MGEPPRIEFTPDQETLIRASRPTFAFPCYGGNVSAETMYSMIFTSNLLAKIGVEFSVLMMPNDSLVPSARNRLVGQMMRIPGSTHLMFIDADIGFNAADIVRLLGHDLDIVGGIYPKKKSPLRFAFNALPAPTPTGIPGVHEVVDLATGFMLIKRSVFERMIEHYPETRYEPDGSTESQPIVLHALFDSEVKNGRYVTEDYTFCRRWRAIGGKVHIDDNIVLKHVGTHTYVEDLSTVREAHEQARRGAEDAAKSENRS